MLLEMWASVLDVVGFSAARIANVSYLHTAVLPLSAQRLVALLGYRPKPAVSTAVRLAALADGADPVLLPAGTAFRSEAFGNEPPQVFETGAAATIWPQRNSWRLAPIRGGAFDGRLLFAGSRPRLAGGQIVVPARGSTRPAARGKAPPSDTALHRPTAVHADPH